MVNTTGIMKTLQKENLKEDLNSHLLI